MKNFVKKKESKFGKPGVINFNMVFEKTCPKCGYTSTCVTVEYNNRKIVFDSCVVCGKKLSDEQEIN